MTVRVVRGPKEFISMCSKCEAVSAYLNEDIIHGVSRDVNDVKTLRIECPHCKDKIFVPEDESERILYEDLNLEGSRTMVRLRKAAGLSKTPAG